MTPVEIMLQLTAPPDRSQQEERDIVRVARLRMRFVDGQWVFDEPQGVSTYYKQREVAEAK